MARMAKPDPVKAAWDFRRACDLKLDEACGDLGVQYLSGNGLPKDEKKGVELIQGACDRGDVEGCGILGDVYMRGTAAIPKDPAKGLAMLGKACDQANATACVKLGDLYQSGKEVTADLAKSL